MSRRAVLIVDDNVVNLELYCELMGLTEYEPVVVDRADAVLAAALAHRPGLVLLDLTLPNSSGFVVAAQLKAEAATAAIPIIALTAMQRDGLVRDLEAAGFLGLVPKPCGVETFLEAVAWAMDLGGTTGFRVFR
jgi:CheY-like chemotaxis protein